MVKKITSEWFRVKHETGEFVKQSCRSLSFCPLVKFGWTSLGGLNTHPVHQTICITQKLQQKKEKKKYQDDNSRLCLESQPLRNQRLDKWKDSWEVESIRAACEGLNLLFGLCSDKRTEIDQRVDSGSPNTEMVCILASLKQVSQAVRDALEHSTSQRALKFLA